MVAQDSHIPELAEVALPAQAVNDAAGWDAFHRYRKEVRRLYQVLERQLAGLGLRCGKDAVARMLREDGFSLQAMAKVLEGRQHPGRDVQFRHINAMIAEFRAAGEPVVSVDAKKKELLGPYHRDGRSWRPAGEPVRVRDHDFPDAELGKITPYGVYDIAANTGFVSVGTSHDTAAFAAMS